MPSHMKCHPFSYMADVGKLFKVGIAFLVRDGREQVFRFAFPYVEADHFLAWGRRGMNAGWLVLVLYRWMYMLLSESEMI